MSNMLKVPGASLYYEVRGAGPTLLLISGGPADADVFAGLVGWLASRYTVVTYDPRGNSRSPFDGPPEDWRRRCMPTTLLACWRPSARPPRTCSQAAAARWSAST